MRFLRPLAALALLASLAGRGAAQSLSSTDSVLARSIFQELIEIVTTDSAAQTYRAARALAARLRAARFPAADVHVVGADLTHGNLVVRYRGRNATARPFIVMAHLDVVPARREDWTSDPFTFLEQDGWYYGRGTSDNKAGAAMLVASFLRLKTEGFVPARDIVMILTGLATGLDRLAAHTFPVEVNEITRTFVERTATTATGQLAADLRGIVATPSDSGALARLSASPYYNSKLRTTCVATRVEAGHANNALPQAARAVVNCRLLPGTAVSDVAATLRRALADERIVVTSLGTPTPSPASPLTPQVLGTLERLVARQFPGVPPPIIPFMEAGVTDGLYLRNAGIPTYGVAAVFADPDDERAHGRDERIGVRSYYDALEFWYRMLRTFGGGK